MPTAPPTMMLKTHPISTVLTMILEWDALSSDVSSTHHFELDARVLASWWQAKSALFQSTQ